MRPSHRHQGLSLDLSAEKSQIRLGQCPGSERSPCLKGSSITESSAPDGAHAGVHALPQGLFKTNQSLQPLNGQGGGPLDVQGLGQIL